MAWKVTAREKNRGYGGIRLTSLVQVLSLKVVRLVMFGRGEEDPAEDINLLALARCINQVWIDSKRQLDDLPPFESNLELRSSLDATFGAHEHPHDNPLNLILPSFETMWHVVLRTFIEVRFKTGWNQPQWNEALIAFVKCPTRQEFEGQVTSTGASMTESYGGGGARTCSKHIIDESLRLYAPTRRVYRAYVPRSDPSEPYQIIAADLEACHLNPSIWGPDAQLFRPTRFLNLTDLQRKALMPFGHSPFECPAKPKFGPQMIGILVGALLAGLDVPEKLDWKLENGDGKALDAGVRLDSHRESYGDLKLVGKSKRT